MPFSLSIGALRFGIVASKVEYTEDHQWTQAGDDVVQKKLESEHARISAAESAIEVLQCSEPDSLRQVFLARTKIYHPNRFARRPEAIRDLANEVFLALKEAYERAGSTDASERLNTARLAATGRHETRAATSRPVAESPERQRMLDRRREELKNRLGGSAPKRTAQIRAATAAISTDTAEQSFEDLRFEEAMRFLNTGDLAPAAEIFKALAVGRPSEKRYRMRMHYTQGKIKQAAGQPEEARSEYKRALGLDAAFQEAHDAMSTLPSENKRKKSGIISKIFGR